MDGGLKYFFDENALSTGKAIAFVRNDVCYPGHRSIPEVPTGTSDEEWLAVIGTHDLVVVTFDKNILKKPAELAQYKKHHVRGIFLVDSDETSAWGKFSSLVKAWDLMEKRVAKEHAGPWALLMSRNSIKDILL